MPRVLVDRDRLVYLPRSRVVDDLLVVLLAFCLLAVFRVSLLFLLAVSLVQACSSLQPHPTNSTEHTWWGGMGSELDRAPRFPAPLP